jgi:hypothetical protein
MPSQPAGDLLGRVVQAKPPHDCPAKLRAALELGRLRPPRPVPGLLVGEVGTVAAPAPAAADLAADRRVRPADRPIRVAAGDAAGDLLALGEGQAPRRAAAQAAGSDPTASHQVATDLHRAEAQPPRDLGIAQPFGSHLPDPIPLDLDQALGPLFNAAPPSFVSPGGLTLSGGAAVT